MSDELGDLLKDEDPKNISTLAIVSTVVSTLNEVITALREEIAAFGETEKHARQKLAALMAVVLIAALASVVGVFLNYRQGTNVKSIVKYIEDCQRPDSECSNRNKEAISAAVISISGTVFDSLTDCVLTTLPERRSDEAIKQCRDKFFSPRK